MVSALKGVVTTGNLPHLLLYGPPGTGKTSSILALAKELWGPFHYKMRILELNASDDRGIKVVREKIKKFAMALPMK
jgi:replication factor C subunit 2/4